MPALESSSFDASRVQLVVSSVGVQGASSFAGFFDVSGSTYSLSAVDKNKIGRFTSGSSVTLTIPSGLPSDFRCMILQMGAGQVTILPGSGVARRSKLSSTRTAYQYAVATLLCVGAEEYLLSGDVVP